MDTMNLPMPVDYRLVQANNCGDLQAQIKALLDQGYTFHGPTTVAAAGVYAQPMVKLEVRPVKMSVNAPVAQSSAQRSSKPKVEGENPSGSTSLTRRRSKR